MSSPPVREPRLVLRFALYAGAAFALAVALSVLLLRWNAMERAQGRILDDAHFIADRLEKDDIVRTAFRWPPPAGAAGEDQLLFLDDLLNHEVVAADVARVTLYAPSGRITYSSEHGVIGATAQRPEVVRAALAGRPSASRERLQTASGAGEEALAAYVPVHWVFEPGVPRGVLEIARPYAPIAADIRQDVLLQAGGITLALLVLYLSLLPIMRRTTRTLAERNRQLASQASELRLTMAQASHGILLCDQEGTLLEVNETLARLSGYAIEELVGMNVRDLLDPEELERVPLRFSEMLEGATIVQPRRLRRKDGTLAPTEFHGTMLEDGRLYAGVVDVAERERVERELREAYRAEALGRLAGGIAGDYGRLMFDVAREGVELRELLPAGSELVRHVDAILEAARQGASLTRQLHEFAEMPQGEREELELNRVLDDVRPALELVAGDDVELVLEPGDDVPPVRAERARLERLVTDLAMNARHAAQGGRLVVSTGAVDFGRRGAARPRDANTRLPAGRYAVLTVGRSGGGVDETGERIALGLAAVYALVQPSGGTIGVETDPGVGTTIRVYLPAADELAAAAVA